MFKCEGYDSSGGYDPDVERDRNTRLGRLAGRPCPMCARAGRAPSSLVFDGRRLRCPAAPFYLNGEHTWSNPDAAEADVVGDRPRSAAERREIREVADRAEAESHRHYQERLEAALGPWMPPEARRS